jgi:hypothetical protein
VLARTKELSVQAVSTTTHTPRTAKEASPCVFIKTVATQYFLRVFFLVIVRLWTLFRRIWGTVNSGL